MGFSRNSRSLVDISRIFISVEFGRILGLVESSGFLRYRVDISRNLRLVDLSRNLRLVDLGRFPKFYFRFRFRAVRYKAFLLITGGSK